MTMNLTGFTMPKVNQDRRIIDTFSLAYDEYCSPYQQFEFSEEVRNAMALNRPLKLSPCKAIFIGDVSVGKTTIVNRFCYDKFPHTYKATIGVDFEVENFRILGHEYCLQIWDTAGQERFKCIAQAYYRNANIIVIVYDMTNEESLQETPTWLESALAVNRIHRPLVFLVGTKSDLLTKEQFIGMERLGYEFARVIKAEYWSVSARTGFNIIELFQRIASLSFDSTMKQCLLETNFFSKKTDRRKIGLFKGLLNGIGCSESSNISNRACLC
ncbi:ras-related protein Rab-34 [Episyrphus balteatus]|uniref:ras-related protein Rab-34 n=1 Tax=Episyrphus balteatus TaxID=286459 RepID=UPI0024860F1E|nr:ras-related protein Rab-34 [Episyrphus balteatus]